MIFPKLSKYPKGFKCTGWHPQCRCVSVPILAPESEMLDYQQKMLDGEDVSGYRFSGIVTSTSDTVQTMT